MDDRALLAWYSALFKTSPSEFLSSTTFRRFTRIDLPNGVCQRFTAGRPSLRIMDFMVNEASWRTRAPGQHDLSSHSFPRSPWECRTGRSASRIRTGQSSRSVEDSIPAETVGMSVNAEEILPACRVRGMGAVSSPTSIDWFPSNHRCVRLPWRKSYEEYR